MQDRQGDRLEFELVTEQEKICGRCAHYASLSRGEPYVCSNGYSTPMYAYSPACNDLDEKPDSFRRLKNCKSCLFHDLRDAGNSCQRRHDPREDDPFCYDFLDKTDVGAEGHLLMPNEAVADLQAFYMANASEISEAVSDSVIIDGRCSRSWMHHPAVLFGLMAAIAGLLVVTIKNNFFPPIADQRPVKALLAAAQQAAAPSQVILPRAAEDLGPAVQSAEQVAPEQQLKIHGTAVADRNTDFLAADGGPADFASGPRTIYYSVNYSGAVGPAVTFVFRWEKDGKIITSFEHKIDEPAGRATNWLKSDFTPGRYEVKLLANGTQVNSTLFSVHGSAETVKQ